MRVVRRFHVALTHYPGWVALYSLIEEGGERRLRWDGICGRERMPSAYARAAQRATSASPP